MLKKIKIILLIICLILIYTGYKSIKKGMALKNSVESLVSFDYEEAKTNIDNISSDFKTNNKTISRESLNDIHDLLTFLRLNYKNLSTISSKATEIISSEHIDNLISNVDALLENNIDREFVSLDEEGLAVINTVLDLYNKFTSTFDKSKLEEAISGDNIKDFFEIIKEKL